MVTIEDVWRTNSGAHLFNGIANMNLVDRNNDYLRFSEKLDLTKQVIGLMLEAGYLPRELSNG